jgi:hypothetical protein
VEVVEAVAVVLQSVVVVEVEVEVVALKSNWYLPMKLFVSETLQMMLELKHQQDQVLDNQE